MIKEGKFQIKGLKAVVFMGSAPNLEKLIQVNRKLGLASFIITSPAQEKEIPGGKKFKSFDRLGKDFEKYVQSVCDVDQTLFVSLGARWIFKEKIIDGLLHGNLVNFHGSRLPLDAGGGGFSWRIMKGDRIDNQLVHLVDEGIDTGPILYTKKSLFPRHCQRPTEYEDYYRKKFVGFYEEFVKKLKKNTKFTLTYQVGYIGKYYPRLATDINGWVDWSWESLEIVRFINAFDSPYAGASTYLNGNRVRLKQVHLHGGDGGNHPFMTGIIVRHDGDWIVVSTQDNNVLLIEEVIDRDGKNIIRDINVGDRFFTPGNLLDEAKSSRVKYGSKK